MSQANGSFAEKNSLTKSAGLELASKTSECIQSFLDPSTVIESSPTVAKPLSCASGTGLCSCAAGYDSFVRSFHPHAAALREAAPWDALAQQQHAFLLGAHHLGASTHVVQLLGSSRRHCGLQIWPSFDDYAASRIHPLSSSSNQSSIPTADPFHPCRLLLMKFEDPKGPTAGFFSDDIALASSLDVSVPSVSDPGNRLFPVLEAVNHGKTSRLTMKDAKIMEAAMAMAITFFRAVVAIAPVPPPPHAIPYNF